MKTLLEPSLPLLLSVSKVNALEAVEGELQETSLILESTGLAGFISTGWVPLGDGYDQYITQYTAVP